MVMIISTLLFAAISLAFILPTLFRAKSLPWEYYAARTILTILSGFVSAAISWLIGGVVSSSLATVLLSLASSELSEYETLIDLVEYPIACGVSSMAFIIIYLIVRPLICLLTGVLYKLIAKWTNKLRKKPSESDDVENAHIETYEDEQNKTESLTPQMAPAPVKKKNNTNAVGMILGGLCGLIVYCTLLAPFVGSLTVLSRIAPAYSLAEEYIDLPFEMGEAIEGVTSNPATYTVRVLGGEPIFRILTTHKVGSSWVSLRRESDMAGAAIDAAMVMIDGDEDEISAAIENFDKKFSKSSLVPEIVVGIANEVSDNLMVDDFFDENGGKYFSSGSAICDEVVNIMKNTTVDTVRSDATKLCRTLAVLIEHDYFDEIDVDRISSDKNTIGKIIEIFIETESDRERIVGLINATVSDISEALALPKNKKVLHDDFLSELTSAANSERVSSVFANYGISIDDLSAETVAACLAQGGTVKNGLKMAETRGIFSGSAKIIVSDQKSFAKVSKVVTIDDLKIKNAEVNNASKEAKAIAATITDLIFMVKDNSFKLDSIATLMAEFGEILDNLKRSELFGGKIPELLSVVLQLPEIGNKVSLDKARAADIASRIVADAKNDSYSSVMRSVGNTFTSVINLLETNKNDNATITEHAADLIRSADPTSVEIVKNVATPELIEDYIGIGSGTKEISSVIVDLLGEFSERREQMTDSQVQTEATALADILELTANINSGGASSGLGGSGVTANKYITSMTSSQIVLDTMIDRTHDSSNNVLLDPFGLEPQLSDSEKSSLVSELNSIYSGKENSRTTAEIEAIGALLGVKLGYTYSGSIVIK